MGFMLYWCLFIFVHIWGSCKVLFVLYCVCKQKCDIECGVYWLVYQLINFLLFSCSEIKELPVKKVVDLQCTLPT